MEETWSETLGYQEQGFSGAARLLKENGFRIVKLERNVIAPGGWTSGWNVTEEL